MPRHNDSANGKVPGKNYPCITREIPSGAIEPLRQRRPSDILTSEELAAFAQDIEQLINDLQYRTITEEVLSDIQRQETARRRLPPPRLKLTL